MRWRDLIRREEGDDAVGSHGAEVGEQGAEVAHHRRVVAHVELSGQSAPGVVADTGEEGCERGEDERGRRAMWCRGTTASSRPRPQITLARTQARDLRGPLYSALIPASSLSPRFAPRPAGDHKTRDSPSC